VNKADDGKVASSAASSSLLSSTAAAAAAASAYRTSASSLRLSWPSVWSSLDEETASAVDSSEKDEGGLGGKSALWWAAEVGMYCHAGEEQRLTRDFQVKRRLASGRSLLLEEDE
jgi:hypothetical protein